MLITFSAATKWGGVANSTDDRTKAQWNQQAGTVSENGMQIGRKGNLALGANSKINKFTMRDMRLGENAGKKGLIFFFFSPCISKSNRDLWNHEDIEISKISVFMSWSLMVLPSFASDYPWSTVRRWEPRILGGSLNKIGIRGRSTKEWKGTESQTVLDCYSVPGTVLCWNLHVLFPQSPVTWAVFINL